MAEFLMMGQQSALTTKPSAVEFAMAPTPTRPSLPALHTIQFAAQPLKFYQLPLPCIRVKIHQGEMNCSKYLCWFRMES
jgi:hypothetical protein